MEKETWIHRDKEWIKQNPGKPTMYKETLKDSDPPPKCATREVKKEYEKRTKRPSVDIGVYIVLCEKAKSVYVGQSQSMGIRMRSHKSCILKMENISRTYREMRIDCEKYGIDSFQFARYLEIDAKIMTNEDRREKLLEKEQETMWDFMRKGYKLYNIQINSNGNTIYCPFKMQDLINDIVFLAIEDEKVLSLLESIQENKGVFTDGATAL